MEKWTKRWLRRGLLRFHWCNIIWEEKQSMILYTQKCVCKIPLDMKAEDIGSKHNIGWPTGEPNFFVCSSFSPLKLPASYQRKFGVMQKLYIKHLFSGLKCQGPLKTGKLPWLGNLYGKWCNREHIDLIEFCNRSHLLAVVYIMITYLAPWREESPSRAECRHCRLQNKFSSFLLLCLLFLLFILFPILILFPSRRTVI